MNAAFASPPSAPRRSSRALMAWALIVIIALMSFYVHVLQQQVVRGERIREQLRLDPRLAAKLSAGMTRPPAALKVARADS